LQLSKEVRSIQHRAAERDGRIVSMGPLVFFSTETGDAWMLEPADQLAVRLAAGGDPLRVHIEETDVTFAVGWQGRYRFDGNAFIYEDSQSGHVSVIHGYPVQQLLAALLPTQPVGPSAPPRG
jgi:hypothetical protein